MTWRVGVSCVDITPPLHIPELGFIPRQHRFQGVHDQLFAKALAAETDDGAVIIVTADAIGFHRNLLGDDKDFIAEFRKRVSQVTGVAF
jgi:neutral ceramidase